MAQEFVSEIGDKLSQGVSNTDGAHVKTISSEYYKRTENGTVTNERIQDAIDNIAPKAKVERTLVQHTVTAEEVANGSSAFSDPIDMPSDYGDLTVAFVSLHGTILMNDTSNVPTSLRIAINYDSSHSYGSETFAFTNIQQDAQVNFVANTQIRLSTGTMHPSGLYLEISNHGLPAGVEIRVNGIVTVFDR